MPAPSTSGWHIAPELDARWDEPVNLGPPINTSLSEFAPALSRDGHWLFFGSANCTTGFEGGAAHFENDELGVPQLF